MNSKPLKRKSYTILKKLDVIALFYKLNQNATECERQTGISRRSLGKWLKQESELKSISGQRDKRRITSQVGRYPVNHC